MRGPRFGRGIIVSDLNAKQQLHLLEMRREIDRFS